MIQLSASTTPKEIQASEMLQIESNSLMIIRLVEELLSVTRTLKENWLLNQMPQKRSETEVVDEVKDFGIVKQIMDEIVQSGKYDEELSEGEEDEIEEKEIVQEIKKDEELKAEEEEDKNKDTIEVKKEKEDVVISDLDEKKETTSTEVKQETDKTNNTDANNNLDPYKIEDFDYGVNGDSMAGNNTIDNISNNLGDYNLTDYGNDNLDGLDFDNFGNDDQNDIIMLD